jgi:hypothetical protein
MKKADLRRRVLEAVKEEMPDLTLTVDAIARITTTTLSSLEGALRKSAGFNTAKLFEHAGNKVKNLLGVD